MYYMLADIVARDTWHWHYLLRLMLAAGLGALIGLEREHHGRTAGFRTMLLVGMGAALVMIVSLHFADVFGPAPTSAVIRADVARAISGVMGGVGFLGAGAIFRQGAGVRGLTTAASLWCTAAVGMACGFGMYKLALVTTALVLFALLFLGMLENWVPARVAKAITVIMPAGAATTDQMHQMLTGRGAKINDIQLEQDFVANEVKVVFQITVSTRIKIADLLDVAKDIPNVRMVAVD